MKIKINDVIFEQDSIIKNGEIENVRTSVGWDNDSIPYSMIVPNLFSYFTARHNDLLVGFISIISNKFSDAYLQDLMVMKDFQNNGIGSILLKKAIKFCQDKNIKAIQLTFNPELESFYRKFGFHIYKAGIIDRDTMDFKIDL